MMTDPTLTEFERRRIDSVTDNKEVSVRDLLRYTLDEIDKGNINPASCVLVLADKDKEHLLDLYYFRSNVNRIEEISYLELAKHCAIKSLFNTMD